MKSLSQRPSVAVPVAGLSLIAGLTLGHFATESVMKEQHAARVQPAPTAEQCAPHITKATAATQARIEQWRQKAEANSTEE